MSNDPESHQDGGQMVPARSNSVPSPTTQQQPIVVHVVNPEQRPTTIWFWLRPVLVALGSGLMTLLATVAVVAHYIGKAEQAVSGIDQKVEASVANKTRELDKQYADKIKEAEETNDGYNSLLEVKDLMYSLYCDGKYDELIEIYKTEYPRVKNLKKLYPTLHATVHSYLLRSYVYRRKYAGLTESEVDRIAEAIERHVKPSRCDTVDKFHIAQAYCISGNAGKARRYYRDYLDTLPPTTTSFYLPDEPTQPIVATSETIKRNEIYTLALLIELGDDQHTTADQKAEAAWLALKEAFKGGGGITSRVYNFLQLDGVCYSMFEHIKMNKVALVRDAKGKLVEKLRNYDLNVTWKTEMRRVGNQNLNVAIPNVEEKKSERPYPKLEDKPVPEDKKPPEPQGSGEC